MRLCHSVIERVILSASDSLNHCTQNVKFQEDYERSHDVLCHSVIDRVMC